MATVEHLGIDEALVRRLLAAQGYDVPEGDLPEIVQRVREAHRYALGWDAYAPHALEPWWPLGVERG